MDYYSRICFALIEKWLFRRKTLVLIGARQVGKSTFLKDLLAKYSNVQFFNADEQRIRDLFEDLSIPQLTEVVGDNKLIVIDEIQRIPNPGLALKLLHDSFPELQVIATGSSALEIADRIFEPLTGRHLLFYLYPFTLQEIYPKKSALDVQEKIPFHLVYGMYPEICNNHKDAKVLVTNLANQYLYKDVLIWKDIRRPDLLDKLLKLLAYQIGSEVSVHELAIQLKVKSETVENYIDLLEKAFVIFRLHAFSNNPRKEVSKMTKIYFWDNGIRNAIIEDFSYTSNRRDIGALWENFIISERMKNNAFLQRNVKSYFWRNYNQAEVDYIELVGDKISAVEIKWKPIRQPKITKAFTNLYPDAKTQIIDGLNFLKFSQVKDE